MKKGDKVAFKITVYPYERIGIVMKHCKVHSIIAVKYYKRTVLVKKKNTELMEIK